MHIYAYIGIYIYVYHFYRLSAPQDQLLEETRRKKKQIPEFIAHASSPIFHSHIVIYL